MVAFADALSALTKKRLLNNRKTSSVTFSDCPPPTLSPSLGNPFALGPFSVPGVIVSDLD